MKTALVTGGGIRLGRAICEKLASSGYSLALHYGRSSTEAEAVAATLRQSYGVEVVLLSADLADSSQVQPLCEQALQRLGGLDLLVNSAAIFHPTRSLAEAVTSWDGFMQVNLKAPFLLAAGCADALKARRGAIVNIADIYAARPLKGYLPYSVAKAGVVALTHGLAMELAPDVRVNAIAPGAMLPPAGVEFTPEQETKWAERVPMQRMGHPSDIADAVFFLANAPYITGQVLPVDGGRSLAW